MAVKYYRPQQKRNITLIPTKRFFILLAIIAAAVVAIILIVHFSGTDNTKENIVSENGMLQTVPATDDENQTGTGDTTTVTDQQDGTDNTAAGNTNDATSDGTNTEGTDNTGDGTTSYQDPNISGSEQPTSYELLKPESEGDAVTKLQERLIELKYMTDKATGYYGTVTEDAVYEFQKKNGLTADGIAGSETQTKLFSDSAVANE